MDGSEPKVFIKENVIKEIMDDSEPPIQVRTASKLPLKETTAKMKKAPPKKIIVAAKEPQTSKQHPHPKTKKVAEPVKAKKKISPTTSEKPKAKPKAKTKSPAKPKSPKSPDHKE